MCDELLERDGGGGASWSEKVRNHFPAGSAIRSFRFSPSLVRAGRTFLAVVCGCGVLGGLLAMFHPCEVFTVRVCFSGMWEGIQVGFGFGALCGVVAWLMPETEGYSWER